MQLRHGEKKDLEEDEGLFDGDDPLLDWEGEDMMEKWKTEVQESQFRAWTTMTYKQAETWAAKHLPGAVCVTSRNDDNSFLFIDTVFHVPDVRDVSHMPSEEKLGTVKSELSPSSPGDDRHLG
jgi:hypothetical protein